MGLNPKTGKPWVRNVPTDPEQRTGFVEHAGRWWALTVTREEWHQMEAGTVPDRVMAVVEEKARKGPQEMGFRHE